MKKSMVTIYSLAILLTGGLLSGCIANVAIPHIDQFTIKSGSQHARVDVETCKKQLISDLYVLFKANEKKDVLICEATKDTKQCLNNGVTFFVWGGLIPGIGKREYYSFENILLNESTLIFTKNNSSTTFIYTPMYVHNNDSQLIVKNGGIQGEMDRYYANWAVVGNMTMAEGWAIDYLDMENGIIGLQLEFDVAGIFVFGGGSKYVLLKFPNVPATLIKSKSMPQNNTELH